MAAKIGLVSRLDDAEAVKVAAKIYKSLNGKGLTVIPEAQFARKSQLDGGIPLSELTADLIVTVGGDGTVLKTCMTIPQAETPILAVNMGRRGFLTEVEPKDAVRAIRLCLNGKYRRDERCKMTVMSNEKRIADALNEVAITSSIQSKMLRMSVSLGTLHYLDFSADGLIIATPTGSTAYSLSAGGPIVDSSLEAFVLSFICPLERLTPIVVSMNNTITIKLKAPKLRGNIIVDGRVLKTLEPSSAISVKKSEEKAVFARLAEVRPVKSLMRLQAAERIIR